MCTNRTGKKHWIFTAAILFAFILSIGGCGGGGGGGTVLSATSLSGIALLSDPLVGATLKVYSMGGILLYQLANATDSGGMFTVSVPGLPSQFFIELTGGTAAGAPFVGYLKRVVNDYSPDAFYEANEVTTLVAGYMAANPSLTYDQAAAGVKTYLSIPNYADVNDVIGLVGITDAYFSGQKFWTAMGAANYSNFMNTLINEIGTGTTRDFSDSTAFNLQPLLDSTKWTLSPGPSTGQRQPAADEPKPKAAPAAAAAVETILEIVGTVVEAVMEAVMPDPVQGQLDAIYGQVNQLGVQVEILDAKVNSILANQAKADWGNLNDYFNPIEKIIETAQNKFKKYVRCQQTKKDASGNVVKDASGNPELNCTAKETAKWKTAWLETMNLKKVDTGGRYYSDFKAMLETYANKVLEGDNANNPAIKVFVNYFLQNPPMDAGKITGPSAMYKDDAYQAVESRFLKFIVTEALGLNLLVQYELNQPDASGNYLSKEERETKKKEIVSEFINAGQDADANPQKQGRFLKTVQTFVPAVESFVFKRLSEQYYGRLAACDNLMTASILSGVNTSSTTTCQDYELPFVRSEYITYMMLRHLKQADGTAAHGAPDLTVKRIQMKTEGEAANVDENKLKGEGLTLHLWNGSSFDAQVQSPFETHTVQGKNPYRASFPTDAEDADWIVATYKFSPTGEFAFFYPALAGANLAANPAVYRIEMYYEGAQDPSANYHNFFTLWTVPVADRTLSFFYDRAAPEKSYDPVWITGCASLSCNVYTVNAESWINLGNTLPPVTTTLQYWKIGKPANPQQPNNYIIGTVNGGIRYILAPTTTKHDPWACAPYPTTIRAFNNPQGNVVWTEQTADRNLWKYKWNTQISDDAKIMRDVFMTSWPVNEVGQSTPLLMTGPCLGTQLLADPKPRPADWY